MALSVHTHEAALVALPNLNNTSSQFGEVQGRISSLDRATSIADVASSAGASISDLLVRMKANAVAALDPPLDTASRNNAALGDLGSQSKEIANHNLFVQKLTDQLTGIGNLVDADLAKESARLRALQVQQQLGAQAPSIANQAPQILLSLFK